MNMPAPNAPVADLRCDSCHRRSGDSEEAFAARWKVRRLQSKKNTALRMPANLTHRADSRPRLVKMPMIISKAPKAATDAKKKILGLDVVSFMRV